ncbi:hypothetical protein A2U01_0069244, partial [Trifolium medium]|nr:hypothetical protein [Trifolium medium]
MARFDVARLKILSATWPLIDVVLKVEVEGVVFSIWVVEERGRHRSVMMSGVEVEDVASLVVLSEASDEVKDGYGGCPENS